MTGEARPLPACGACGAGEGESCQSGCPVHFELGDPRPECLEVGCSCPPPF